MNKYLRMLDLFLIAVVVLVSAIRLVEGLSSFALLYIVLSLTSAICIRQCMISSGYFGAENWIKGRVLWLSFFVLVNILGTINVFFAYFSGNLPIFAALGTALFTGLIFSAFAFFGEWSIGVLKSRL